MDNLMTSFIIVFVVILVIVIYLLLSSSIGLIIFLLFKSPQPINPQQQIQKRSKKEDIEKVEDQIASSSTKLFGSLPPQPIDPQQQIQQKSESVITLNARQRRRVALHEAGHTVIAYILRVPIDKVTIKGKSPFLGLTLLNDANKPFIEDQEFDNYIMLAMASRATEQKFFEGFGSSLTSHDMAQIKEFIYKKKYMNAVSKNLGLWTLKDDCSQHMQKMRDDEIITEINNLWSKTVTLVSENEALIQTISDRLLENEEITRRELYRILEA
uniref:Peptidase M41 domain-containing protein n=1 Tax=Meloidogyne javanica TaxID=6303 RepID=A0A915M9R9_MELJA